MNQGLINDRQAFLQYYFGWFDQKKIVALSCLHQSRPFQHVIRPFSGIRSKLADSAAFITFIHYPPCLIRGNDSSFRTLNNCLPSSIFQGTLQINHCFTFLTPRQTDSSPHLSPGWPAMFQLQSEMTTSFSPLPVRGSSSK